MKKMHMACENEKMVWKVSLNILWHHIKFEKHFRSWFWNHKVDLVLSIRNLLENIDDKKFRLRFQLKSFEYYEMRFYKLKIVKWNFSWLLTNGKCTRNSFFEPIIWQIKLVSCSDWLFVSQNAEKWKLKKSRNLSWVGADFCSYTSVD